MIKFLIKGLLRDRHRSTFPVIVVTLGVALAVLAYCFMYGMIDEAVRSNAKIDTGHVKVMTRGYRAIASQAPNDLAVQDLAGVISELSRDYPDMEWTARIKYGGLLDIPDEFGETRSQGPVMGMAVDILGAGSREVQRLGLEGAIHRGRMPEAPGEILVSDDFASTLGVEPGETATFIGSTAHGALAASNFVIAGTIRFGIGPMDRNTMIADIADIQYALDMEGAASEILGFFPNMVYNRHAADTLSTAFNSRRAAEEDDFTPAMVTLRQQNGLGEYLDIVGFRASLMLLVFFIVMSIVLWNAGLMSGIRRYGEIGIRLAIGESKDRVYIAMLSESIVIGIAGSALGTALGLGVSYYLQEVGLDVTSMTQSSGVLMANVIRAKITAEGYYIGFVPGLLATMVGTAISGIGIFKRQTAQLFKELEA
jgi:putative ABC transport system permease protein